MIFIISLIVKSSSGYISKLSAILIVDIRIFKTVFHLSFLDVSAAKTLRSDDDNPLIEPSLKIQNSGNFLLRNYFHCPQMTFPYLNSSKLAVTVNSNYQIFKLQTNFKSQTPMPHQSFEIIIDKYHFQKENHQVKQKEENNRNIRRLTIHISTAFIGQYVYRTISGIYHFIFS